ncbi:uncharacterized protein [Anoplolepis gracilipes]|uniref:uncharacterized protein n=1 Tax=Anoplolepis gracilipes TaxID=354296 RepID=UPI003BA36B53
MQILSFNFFLYTISGMWRPIECSSKCSKILYNMFTYLMMCLLLILILTQLLDIILIVDNVDDFTTNSFMLFTVISVFFKAATTVIRRDKIINLIETLQKKPCKAYTEEESDILMKFDRLIRSYSINYMYLAMFAATGGLISGIFNVIEGQLPFRIWVPYDYTSPIILWLTSIQELIILICALIINIATDTTVLGFCLQICAQIEMLKHRLHKMTKLGEKKTSRNSLNDALKKTGRLSGHILHHLSIIKLAKIINKIFIQVIFVQFFASMIVLCTMLYYLSSHMTITDVATMTVFSFGMFVQIFVYCWAGNEVILKSTGLGVDVYQMDWILMPINEQQDLLMIMKRSTRPIKLSSSFLVTLSLESYCNLLKATYSIFNLLHNQSAIFPEKLFLLINMQLFSLNFLMYTISGIWRPIEWSSNIAKLLYSVFTFTILFLSYFLMLTQFMDILLVVDNIDDFATNTLMFLTIVAVTFKATIVVVRRKAIIKLVETLLTSPCKPQNEDEMAIQRKFDKFIRSCSIKYSLLATGSITGTTVRSVLNVTQGYLPYRVWVPYDIDTSPMFMITSIQQIVTLVFATIINVGTETLVFGLCLQTCAQFEIFENRLHKLISNKIAKYLKPASSTKKKTIISEYIHHHLSIYKYAKKVNVVFNQVLFVQFFGSILVLCTSVYYLSAHITESESATLIIYTICMFAQIFVYCWSGNEVILKSLSVGDSIYRMDWPSLSVSEKKEMLMIMMRCTLPIKFTSSFLITLSLQSYTGILKISYSAFSVLQK